MNPNLNKKMHQYTIFNRYNTGNYRLYAKQMQLVYRISNTVGLGYILCIFGKICTVRNRIQ